MHTHANKIKNLDCSANVLTSVIRCNFYVPCSRIQTNHIIAFVFQLLGFMYGWLTFYHHGHEVAKDYKPHMTELQTRIQKVLFYQ